MKKLILLFLLFAVPAQAQVAHNTGLDVESEISDSDPITITGKTTTGSNRFGVVHIGGQSFGTYPYITGITWGGTAMTPLATSNHDMFGSLWGTVGFEPPTGSSSIVITVNGFTLGGVGISSYSGVHQTVSTSDPQISADDSSTVTVTSAVGDMVVDAIGEYNQTIAVDAGQTEVFNEPSGVVYGGGSWQDGAASVVMSWTHSGTLHSMVAINLEAAGGGSPPSTTGPRRTLMGVGD